MAKSICLRRASSSMDSSSRNVVTSTGVTPSSRNMILPYSLQVRAAVHGTGKQIYDGSFLGGIELFGMAKIRLPAPPTKRPFPAESRDSRERQWNAKCPSRMHVQRLYPDVSRVSRNSERIPNIAKLS